jgi:hypothetical protein
MLRQLFCCVLGVAITIGASGKLVGPLTITHDGQTVLDLKAGDSLEFENPISIEGRTTTLPNTNRAVPVEPVPWGSHN